MTQRLLPLACLCVLSGCGCGDTFATRQVRIAEAIPFSADSVHWRPIEVDTSRLPPGTHVERSERKDACGNPITELTIIPHDDKTERFKIVLVPANDK